MKPIIVLQDTTREAMGDAMLNSPLAATLEIWLEQAARNRARKTITDF
jgi:hypothetical protein